MADRPLDLLSDADLEAALRGLTDGIAWPESRPVSGDGPDLAATVRARIDAAQPGGAAAPRTIGTPRARLNWRPARRALVAAVIILLALAVLAGAAGLGLPGLRLILGPAPVSPPPSLEPSRSPAAGVPGATMGLGRQVSLADLDARAGFAVTWPADPAIGPPDAAYVDPTKGGQVALVWRSREGLPDTLEPGVGLVLTEFRGAVDDGFFSKALGSGTRVQPATVHGQRAFWLSGDPHFLFYQGPDGSIHESRDWIGDALLWARGPITYRLETSLGQDAATRLAESMP
jgi:hypothetical protein